MAGSPTQLELWDPKPTLQKYDGQDCPQELLEGKRFAFIKGVPKLLGTPYQFARHGQAGTAVSELLPHFSKVVDDVAVIRSMTTDQFNHAPAQLYLHTGNPRLGYASMGSWATYGLGTENQDLPGFVVLVSGNSTPSAGKSLWGAGFLPSVYQGVQCRTQGDPVLYLSDPEGMSPHAAAQDAGRARRSQPDAAEAVRRPRDRGSHRSVRTRLPHADLGAGGDGHLQGARRDAHALRTEPGQVSFANNCLLARRLVENGVRFVQLYHWGWDHHGSSRREDIRYDLPNKARSVDRPMAALIQDLKQRGLLDSTMVVWGGEFGRTPMRENRGGKYTAVRRPRPSPERLIGPHGRGARGEGAAGLNPTFRAGPFARRVIADREDYRFAAGRHIQLVARPSSRAGGFRYEAREPVCFRSWIFWPCGSRRNTSAATSPIKTALPLVRLAQTLLCSGRGGGFSPARVLRSLLKRLSTTCWGVRIHGARVNTAATVAIFFRLAFWPLVRRTVCCAAAGLIMGMPLPSTAATRIDPVSLHGGRVRWA
jgi:hypothetical protein